MVDEQESQSSILDLGSFHQIFKKLWRSEPGFVRNLPCSEPEEEAKKGAILGFWRFFSQLQNNHRNIQYCHPSQHTSHDHYKKIQISYSTGT